MCLILVVILDSVEAASRTLTDPDTLSATRQNTLLESSAMDWADIISNMDEMKMRFINRVYSQVL